MPSNSEFARFEDRVDETIEKQVSRVETKLDEIGRQVRNLAVLEDRQARAERQVDELRAASAAMGERFDRRVTAICERSDERISELAEKYQQLESKVDRHWQRFVGGSMCIAALWAVASHFTHLLK